MIIVFIGSIIILFIPSLYTNFSKQEIRSHVFGNIQTKFIHKNSMSPCSDGYSCANIFQLYLSGSSNGFKIIGPTSTIPSQPAPYSSGPFRVFGPIEIEIIPNSASIVEVYNLSLPNQTIASYDFGKLDIYDADEITEFSLYMKSIKAESSAIAYTFVNSEISWTDELISLNISHNKSLEFNLDGGAYHVYEFHGINFGSTLEIELEGGKFGVWRLLNKTSVIGPTSYSTEKYGIRLIGEGLEGSLSIAPEYKALINSGSEATFSINDILFLSQVSGAIEIIPDSNQEVIPQTKKEVLNGEPLLFKTTTQISRSDPSSFVSIRNLMINTYQVEILLYDGSAIEKNGDSLLYYRLTNKVMEQLSYTIGGVFLGVSASWIINLLVKEKEKGGTPGIQR
jgi:hypothetical protein